MHPILSFLLVSLATTADALPRTVRSVNPEESINSNLTTVAALNFTLSDFNVYDADQASCHGVGGEYWVRSRDIAVGNVYDFCGQSEQYKRYNEGTEDALELYVKHINGDTSDPLDAPDCVGRFLRAVIDGCDGNDPVNNPYNYKFGGTLRASDGWTYTMAPMDEKVNEVHCDVTYGGVESIFEVRGKNLPDAQLGVDGVTLWDEIKKCGTVTGWHFNWTPQDCCFQWYAYGQITVGTKACIGRALLAAGGSSKGNCHGAG